ncbi:MAG TPA: sodium-translocating pyrophosphatase, partial [Chloroflexi bacterium]|nr:sodium-translocating pyrophosphatase [Chloroflexota bacterium]
MAWEIVALVSGVISIAVAAYFYRWVLSQESSNAAMNEFSGAIQDGAATYLKRLFQVLGVLVAIFTIIMFIAISWQGAIAYLIGSICAAAAAYAGMYIATRANARVAWAARDGLQKAFPIAFYAGSVMGLATVGFALIGMTGLYMIFRDTEVVLAFSFGASALALLAKA